MNSDSQYTSHLNFQSLLGKDTLLFYNFASKFLLEILNTVVRAKVTPNFIS